MFVGNCSFSSWWLLYEFLPLYPWLRAISTRTRTIIRTRFTNYKQGVIFYEKGIRNVVIAILSAGSSRCHSAGWTGDAVALAAGILLWVNRGHQGYCVLSCKRGWIVPEAAYCVGRKNANFRAPARGNRAAQVGGTALIPYLYRQVHFCWNYP